MGTCKKQNKTENQQASKQTKQKPIEQINKQISILSRYIMSMVDLAADFSSSLL